MQELIERICERLRMNAYSNEAAISHGIVTPIIAALGWDSADPLQLVPEYSVDNGRVDFALIGLNRKPVIFIEVKAVGKATDADRQVFEYSFHHGVPLCVLTDGREWSFYVPSGVGSYQDRRVYRLQLDERTPAECEQIFQRYLQRERVRSGAAFADAQHDHQTAAGRREATALLPKAWSELVSEAHELIVNTLAEKPRHCPGSGPMIRLSRHSCGGSRRRIRPPAR
jgi:predicted type IV restriction endonuclease